MRSKAFGSALAVFLLAGCSLVGVGGSVGPNEWWLEGASPDGRHLLVSSVFGGVASGCSRWEGWEIDADADRVAVRAMLWEKHAPSDCTDDAATRRLELTLPEGLGERDLTGCGYEDCGRAPFPDWIGGAAGWLLATGDSVVAASGETLRVFGPEGSLDWEKRGGAESPVATSEVVVTSEGGAGMTAWALDAGQRLWEVESGHPVAAHGDLVLTCGGQVAGTLEALDAASGTVRWTAQVPCGSPAFVDDRLIMVGNDPEVDGGHELIVADVRTGELLRRESFHDGVDDRVAAYGEAMASGDRVVVGSWQGDLVVLDARGEERLRVPRRGRPLGVIADIVIIEGADGWTAVDLAVGDVVWERAADGSLQLDVAGNTLLALHGSSGRLSRLDPASGEELWRAAIGRTSQMQTAATPDAVYVSTTVALVAIDSRTGEVDWWEHLPPEVDERHEAAGH